MNLSKLAVVILSWNSDKYISDCLKSLLDVESRDITVYVLDNGSKDNSKAIIEGYVDKFEDKIEYVSLPKNQGTTKTRNVLLKKITSDTAWIMILDSDTVVNQDAIEKLIETLEKNPKALIASPRMWRADDDEMPSCKKFPTFVQKLYKAVPIKKANEKGRNKEIYSFFPSQQTNCGSPPISFDDKIYEVDYAISACWMMPYSVLEIAGYLDERFFYAPEDVDYCATIRENGYKVLFTSNASIYHYTQRISHKKMISMVNFEHIKGLIKCYIKHKKFWRTQKKILRGNSK